MLLKFYGTYRPFPSQLEFAKKVSRYLGDQYYRDGIWTWLETTPVIGDWAWALMYYGLLEGTWSSTISFDTVVSDIDANRLIMIIYRTEEFKSHAVVINGYTDNPGSDDDHVCFVDPDQLYREKMYYSTEWATFSRSFYRVFRTKPHAFDGSVVTLQEQAHKLYLHVYDSQGRHVGMNHQTQSIETGIPGAEYFDFGESIIIGIPPNIVVYRYVVDATRAEQPQESYEIVLSSIQNGSLVSETRKPDVIAQNELKEYRVGMSNTVEAAASPFQNEYTFVMAVLVLGVISAGAAYGVRRRRQRPSVETRPRVKEIRSTLDKPRVKSIQETGTKPKVLKVEDE
jgi:hypothetical protein